MLRLCMIDDINDDLVQLKEYLINRINSIIKWEDTESFPFSLVNEQTGDKYDRDEQIERIYQTVYDNWKKYDVFLLDWSLLGSNDEDENAVSVEVLRRIFTNKIFCEDVKSESKFVIIVTGKLSRGVSFSFDDLDNKIICVDKPSGEPSIFSKPCCRCPKGIFSMECGLYSKREIECNADDCLSEILKTINLIMEGNP